MSVLPSIVIEEFHAGEHGLIIFYNTNQSDETHELELTKHQAAQMILKAGWVDDVNVFNDTVVLRFETILDDINHNGGHVQRIYKMVIEWSEYRSWIVKREVRDIVKLHLKNQNQNGIDSSQSGGDQHLDQ